MVTGTQLKITVWGEYLLILMTYENISHSNLTLFMPVHTHPLDSGNDAYLDLFFARNASNINWEKIATAKPSHPGNYEEIVYANFFIPTGSFTQAIRVQLRNGGDLQNQNPCVSSTTGTNDRVSFWNADHLFCALLFQFIHIQLFCLPPKGRPCV